MDASKTLDSKSYDAALAAVYSSIMAVTVAFVYADEVEDYLEAHHLMRHKVKQLFNAVARERTAVRLTLGEMLTSDYYRGFAADVSMSAYREAEPMIEDLRMAVAGYLICKGCATHQEACRAVVLYALSMMAEKIIDTWIDFLSRHPMQWAGGQRVNARRVFMHMKPSRFTAAARRLGEYLLGDSYKADFRESPDVQACINRIMETVTGYDVVRRAIDHANRVAYKLDELYLPVKESEYKAIESGKADHIAKPLTPRLVKQLEGRQYNSLKVHIGATRYTRRYMLKGIERSEGRAVFLIGPAI